MAVEVKNMEPAQKVDLKTENQTSNVLMSENANTKKQVVKDAPKQETETNSIDKFENNYKNALNSSMKTTIEATTVSLQAETGLDKIKSNLTELRDTANKVGMGNLSEDELYKAQFDFESIKNNINSVAKENNYQGQNLFEKLNQDGIQYQINKNTTVNLAFKKNDEEVAGFNKNNMTIENLNVFNTENAQKASDSLNKAINYVDEKKNDINTSQNTISNELTKLLSKTENGYKSINSDEEAKNETNSIAALILTNSNESSMAQANSRYENYLNLLKVSATAETEV